MKGYGWLVAWFVFVALLGISAIQDVRQFEADLEDRMDTIRAERSEGRFER